MYNQWTVLEAHEIRTSTRCPYTLQISFLFPFLHSDVSFQTITSHGTKLNSLPVWGLGFGILVAMSIVQHYPKYLQ